MRIKFFATAAAAFVLAAASHASAGGTPIVITAPSDSYNTVGAGGTFDSFQVTSGSVDVIGTYWQAPPTGGGSVDLSGNEAGIVLTNFAAPTGSDTLTFYLSGNPDGYNGQIGATGKDTVTVTVNGVTQDFSFDTSVQNNTKDSMGYIEETMSFTGAATNSLSFKSDNDGPYGAVVGGISISAAPEPATWALMFGGLFVLGAALRLRRKQVLVATA